MPRICFFLKVGLWLGSLLQHFTNLHYFFAESIWRFKEAVETSDICPLSTCHCDLWEVVSSRFFDLCIDFSWCFFPVFCM